MRRSIIALLLPALFLLPGDVRSQTTVELSGVVLDSITGQPIVNAIVRVPALQRYTLTDGSGGFRFSDVPAGVQTVVVVQLGYSETTLHLDVQSGTVHILRITPQPVRLAPIVVDNGLMNSMAERRVLAMQLVLKEPVFWRSWDERDIQQSGIGEPLTFLRREAKLVVQRCARLGLPVDRLCLAVPFAGAPWPGAIGGSFSWRPRTIGEGGVRRVFRGTTTPGSIYLDDRGFGRLEDLERLDMNDIARIETYGYRGERTIRMYTHGYMRLVAAGIVRPDITTPPEVYEASRRRFEPSERSRLRSSITWPDAASGRKIHASRGRRQRAGVHG
jgi:hypothetical protein